MREGCVLICRDEGKSTNDIKISILILRGSTFVASYLFIPHSHKHKGNPVSFHVYFVGNPLRESQQETSDTYRFQQQVKHLFLSMAPIARLHICKSESPLLESTTRVKMNGYYHELDTVEDGSHKKYIIKK